MSGLLFPDHKETTPPHMELYSMFAKREINWQRGIDQIFENGIGSYASAKYKGKQFDLWEDENGVYLGTWQLIEWTEDYQCESTEKHGKKIMEALRKFLSENKVSISEIIK